MTYVVTVTRPARKQLDRLPRRVQNEINEIVVGLSANPRPIGVTKMAGTTNRYRVRAGSYRIVYDIYDDTRLVEVAAIGHRSVVYRHLSLLLILLRMRS